LPEIKPPSIANLSCVRGLYENIACLYESSVPYAEPKLLISHERGIFAPLSVK